MSSLFDERDELANERAFGLTEADYEEMADIHAAMDEEQGERGTVCDCDYCGEVSLCYPDGTGGKGCVRCLDDFSDETQLMEAESYDHGDERFIPDEHDISDMEADSDMDYGVDDGSWEFMEGYSENW